MLKPFHQVLQFLGLLIVCCWSVNILDVAGIAFLLFKEQLLEFRLCLLHLFPRLLLLEGPQIELASILRRVGLRWEQCRRLARPGLLILQLHHELVMLSCMLA